MISPSLLVYPHPLAFNRLHLFLPRSKTSSLSLSIAGTHGITPFLVPSQRQFFHPAPWTLSRGRKTAGRSRSRTSKTLKRREFLKEPCSPQFLLAPSRYTNSKQQRYYNTPVLPSSRICLVRNISNVCAMCILGSFSKERRRIYGSEVSMLCAPYYPARRILTFILYWADIIRWWC